MTYLRIVSYIYLLAAAFFTYKGIEALQTGENSIIMFGLAAIGIFMFFFRRSYAKKFERREKK